MMGWLAGGEGGVEEHEGNEGYLRVCSVGVGDGRKWGRGGAVHRRPWARRTAALPAMGMLPGDEGGVEEHEGDEDYL